MNGVKDKKEQQHGEDKGELHDANHTDNRIHACSPCADWRRKTFFAEFLEG
jgi:hypothetical protein